MSDRPMRRVSVIGASGSGKTTFAAALAERMGVPHIELDTMSLACPRTRPDRTLSPPLLMASPAATLLEHPTRL